MPFVGVLMTIGKEVVAHGTLRLVGIVYILNLMAWFSPRWGFYANSESLSMIIKDRRVSMVVPAALMDYCR
jgi:hypothetical protein